MKKIVHPTPAELGFRFPAEWEKHKATWLGYPFQETSWPGRLEEIKPYFARFAVVVSKGENVHLNVQSDAMEAEAREVLSREGAVMEHVVFYRIPANDGWFRDAGPAFLVNDAGQKAIVNWNYNAWGNKYDHTLDDMLPVRIAELYGMKYYSPGIVMEGGSVDFNSKGTILTTTSCLLHENRNPGLDRKTIEEFLIGYYGAEQVLWLKDGIEGDDTNGHVDDITRFVNEDTVITMVEANRNDSNHVPLAKNLDLLKKMRLLNGKQMNIVEIPMPSPVYYDDIRLPASYANFYMANHAVIVPTYRCEQDEKAIDILSSCFNDRPVIGIDSTAMIWGLGSFHCLSQQEPL